MNHNRQFIDNSTGTNTSSSTSSSGSSTSTSTTTTTVSTEPGVSQDYEAIKDAYCSAIGPLTAPVAWYLEGLMQGGMEPEVILVAIHDTGWARRPSPQYLRAILERYRLHGILTMPQLLHDQQEFAEAKHWYED